MRIIHSDIPRKCLQLKVTKVVEVARICEQHCGLSQKYISTCSLRTIQCNAIYKRKANFYIQCFPSNLLYSTVAVRPSAVQAQSHRTPSKMLGQ